MTRDAIRDAAQETKMELTPMIDVTFLLLVFFLCSIQFKVLEGRLQTYLPRGIGCPSPPIDSLTLAFDIRVERILTPNMLLLEDAASRAAWSRRLPTPDELRIQVQDRQMPDLNALAKELVRVRDAYPAPTAVSGQGHALGTDDDWFDPVRITLTAEPGVLYADIIDLIDVILETGSRNVTFRHEPTPQT